MRPYLLALAGLLMSACLYAQQPPQTPPAQTPPAPAADPAQAQLDTLLNRWEQEMKRVEAFVADCNRTTIDKTWGSAEEFVGKAKFLKPNYAMLEMQKKGNPEIYEKYICSGTYLYEYAPQSKVIRIHELPAPKPGQVNDDNLLSFLFGMKAEEAKRRYDLKLAKTDQYYYYIDVLPRLPADKADFQRARLTLNTSNFLPRQVWFEQPNGNEVTWNLPKIDATVMPSREEFAPPKTLPQGWNLVRMPRAEAPRTDVPPRVVRPNQ